MKVFVQGRLPASQVVGHTSALLRTSCLAALAALIVATCAPRLRAGAVNIGGGWTATAPAGYDVAPDFPANGQLGDLVPLGQSTTLALPIALIVPNWGSLNKISITFTNNRMANDPPPPDHMALRVRVGNDTNVAWSGFSFDITDNNGTAQNGQPNLTHPFSAHWHVSFLEQNTIGYNKITSTPDYGNSLAPADITDRGLYTFTLSDGFLVQPNDVWSPRMFDLHDRAKTAANGDYITSFTIGLKPIPEPSAIVMAMTAVGLVGLAGWNRRRTHF